MIPIRLELRNFLAYRECDPLDFSGLRTVCLTGDNGAGKSSLLDAMTWALWGQARARRDDELIAQHETEARVALTFSEGDQTFQVVRTRKLGRATGRGRPPASSGTLDLLVQNEGGWRSLSEPRMSETQVKIERLLNLTYETFVNSAYLKQGRADEFTLRTPAERKGVLAEILSLDSWAAYEDVVRGRQNTLARDQALKASELEKAEAEIARAPEYARDAETAAGAERAAREAMEAAEGELATLQQARARATALRAQLEQGLARQKDLDAEQAGIARDADAQREALAASEAALAQRDVILRGFADLEAAQATNEAFNLKLVSLTELNARKTEAENALATARREIERERDTAELNLRALETEAEAVDRLAGQLSEVNDALSALEAQGQRREALQAEIVEARERQGAWRADNETLRRDMNDLAARIKALETVGAICPTCGRPLAEDDRVRLLEAWRGEGKQRGDTFRVNQTAIAGLAERVGALEREATTLNQALLRLPAVQREASAIEERLARSGAALEKVPAAREALRQARAPLEAAAYAPAARTALAAVMDELKALGYDAAAHAAVRDGIAALQGYAEKRRMLDRAEFASRAARSAIEALTLRRDGLAARQSVEQRQNDELRASIEGLDGQLRALPAAEAALQRERTAFFAAQRKLGEAHQRLAACEAMATTRARLREELEGMARLENQLRILREAFGRNGIPAMIIEAALPELEAYANRLLGRMSNGRMNVRFETQRATLAGETRETLEIRISDELGERPYELFSGGEAFRVNFAIRIALSRLLAHRAGARLQTLFVDEGFGTQDAQGRERLIEALRLVEDEFERILIITHIDELKDAFPARIEVIKTQKGSVARVV
ncbi:MAG: SMC family ATPase [Thermoflexales bacterium]|nr:SMC family ATPase [Thermoflexales bacterium]